MQFAPEWLLLFVGWRAPDLAYWRRKEDLMRSPDRDLQGWNLGMVLAALAGIECHSGRWAVEAASSPALKLGFPTASEFPLEPEPEPELALEPAEALLPG